MTAWFIPSGCAKPKRQSPVSLNAIDGESITDGTQSNFAGNGVWTRMGYTYARDWTGPKPGGGTYNGFDDPTFMPICIWLADFVGTSFYARADDLGINGFLPAWTSVSLADLNTYGKWALVTNPEVSSGSISSADDPAVIGVSSGEEPSSDARFVEIIAENAAWLAGGDGPGRLALYNFADHVINGGFETTTPDEMVAAGDWITSDQYWIAGAAGGSNSSPFKANFRLYQDLGEPSASECARGSHYGSHLDAIRKHYSGPSGPFGVWIENGAPYEEERTGAMSPAQLKWAVWATLVHGARSIHYFNHTFRKDDPGASFNNFNNNYYGGPSVAGTGIYAAAKEVNLNALSIAPAINGPFDGYFVFGDVVHPNAETTGRIDTPGFLTAVTSTNSRLRFSGVDACCKWNPLENKHYILATTREAEAATNIPVTFRMVDQGQTTAVRLFGTPGSIAISRGGSLPPGFCEFSDTFANASDYKAYRID